MNTVHILLIWIIIWAIFSILAADYNNEIIETQAGIIEELSFSLEGHKIQCENLYWRTDMSGKDTVQELCGEVWEEVYNFTK